MDSTTGMEFLDSPLRISLNGFAPFMSGSRHADRVYPRLAFELGQWGTGFMPTSEFLDTFLPCKPSDLERMPSPKGVFDTAPAQCKESELYAPIVRIQPCHFRYLFISF